MATHTCNKEAEVSAIQRSLEMLAPQIREVIDINMSSVRAQMQANHDLSMVEFTRIKEKQDIANCRVTKLEVDTKFARLVQEYPKVSVFIFIVILSTMGSIGFYEVLQMIKSVF